MQKPCPADTRVLDRIKFSKEFGETEYGLRMLVDAYNAFEVGLWTVLAFVVAVRYRHSVAGLRRTAAIASVLLLSFAISDVIEMQTGAWWRPWPLFVLKGTCLIGLTWCAYRLVGQSRRPK